MSKDLEPSVNPQSPRLEERHSRFPWKTVIAVIVIAGIMSIIAMREKHPSAQQGKKGPGGRGSNAPVTAIIGTVMQKDVPIYLDGLGTVQAFNTVTVRSRVDGQLKKLSFTEGQDVQAGDPLAQIDPDPF